MTLAPPRAKRPDPAPRPSRAADRSRHTGPPIFISGCNRGGTTIVSQILAAHPEVRNVGRGMFNEGQYIWRRRFHDYTRHRWAVWPWSITMRRTAADATPEVIEYLQEGFEAAMPSPGRMLEKSPSNAVRIPLIDRVYPECRFLHVLRDGRDTTASLIARRVWWPYAPHQWVGAHTTALGDLETLAFERVTLIRYEEMLAEPERVLRTVCRSLDLGWGEREREAVLGEARACLRPPDDRWARLDLIRKRYVLSVIEPLQKELGYPLEP
jgi:hypothetical protein